MAVNLVYDVWVSNYPSNVVHVTARSAREAFERAVRYTFVAHRNDTIEINASLRGRLVKTEIVHVDGQGNLS